MPAPETTVDLQATEADVFSADEVTSILDRRDHLRAELAQVDDEELRRVERACWWKAAELRDRAWKIQGEAHALLIEAQDLDYRRKQATREQAKRNGFDVEGDAP